MPTSQRFAFLQKRIAELELRFLPASRPLGNYTAEEKDGIRSYRVLAHAEFEAFFEDRALHVANKAHARYAATHKSTRVLNCIYQTFCRERELTGVGDRFDKAVMEFQKLVRRNHGVKEKNLCGLLLPLGIQENELDISWLNAMSSFGQKRGEVAHSSAKVQTFFDPSIEKALVQQVTVGTKAVDELFSQLK